MDTPNEPDDPSADDTNPVQAAITAARGLTAFASSMEVSKQTAHNWRMRSQPPVQYALSIEVKYGISRKVLRPDDWHLIWPELINAEGAPPVAATAGHGEG